MKIEKTKIRVGPSTTRNLNLQLFESIQEAIDKFGEEKVLTLINYSFTQTQRANKRAQVLALWRK